MSSHRFIVQTLGLAGGTAALVFSVMVAQGLYLNKITPRFAPPDDPTEGVIGEGEPAFRVVLLGESPVAGVGAPSHPQALSGTVATMLSQELGSAVAWRAIGKNGVTAATCTQQLVPHLEGERPDVMVVVIGTNDVMLLTRLGKWTADARRMLAEVRAHVGPEVPILFSGVPPMGAFPAFRLPLRAFVQARSRLLDWALRRVVLEDDNAWHAPLPNTGVKAYFCSDRFHPSPMGYAAWAEALRPTARLVINAALARRQRQGATGA
mgnify:CR=1 FL=1